MLDLVYDFLSIGIIVFPIYFIGFFVGRWYYKPKS